MMKKLILATVGVAFTASILVAKEPSKKEVYSVEKSESSIAWLGKKITGQHNGSLSISGGEISVFDSNVSGVKVTMDMNSITCADLTNKSMNDKLVGHLKSDDFFSSEKFPTSTFEATEFKPITGAAANSDNYTVTGKLSMKGISQTIVFPARVDVKNGKLNAKGTAVIDRTKFDIKYGSGSFFSDLGDRAINDNFEITFNLVAKTK